MDGFRIIIILCILAILALVMTGIIIYYNMLICKDGFSSKIYFESYKSGFKDGYLSAITEKGEHRVELVDPRKSHRSAFQSMKNGDLIIVCVKPKLKWNLIITLDLLVCDVERFS